ncbi:methyltransferase, TIGR04325 family [Mucilaginibacter terrenus]|uniref:Methyltransferase, TIGR04325 family n=1 Tax=Mucilaginibacter terrenus TaxID=2482727 RepID=A0A3E2NMQ8_9SPHI|nr:methyltransferase, TIGR04325 family [Mucilaginibacter terrenus]RFZ82233.1 methyltransferase, TIGR04325 family [Mucilaginibacter terrenus]
MPLAPIVLFVYSRPEHTRQVLTALAANELANDSTLYIFADGAKHDADAEALKNIEETRKVIREKQWCREVFITESVANKGLAGSVISGVTQVVNKHGAVIVLEDDLITSRYFLRFMNEALTTYREEQNVLSIGALNFFAADDAVSDTFFVPIPDCWGWATWADRWQLFEPNPQKLLNQLREQGLISKFNLHGAYRFEDMLIDQIKGNVNSWAIRWQAVAYLENKLTLYPKHSVTKNIGFGAGGTHGGNDQYTGKIKFAETPVKVKKLLVAENESITRKMIEGYREVTLPSQKAKAKRAIREQVKQLIPPGLSSLYRKARPHKGSSVMWAGNYKNWEEAQKETSGYEDASILQKTKAAILKVKNGEAAGERDSVLFDKVPYSWPAIAGLLKATAENDNKLNVIDFGGALGSSYFQFKAIAPFGAKLQWTVVEQPAYVDPGNADVADGVLNFAYTIDEALQNNKANVLLLSSVLQYLPNPYGFVASLSSYNFKYILIDRTSFIAGNEQRLTIQNVPSSIHRASYACWFFNEEVFIAVFKNNYQLIADFDSHIDYPSKAEDGAKLYWKGFLFKLNEA